MLLDHNVITKFWESVYKTDKCWFWLGTILKSRSPYGQFVLAGHKYIVHRLSWQLHNGVIPAGHHVLHHCDIFNCVNPEDLFLGTNADNMKDRHLKGCYAHRLELPKLPKRSVALRTQPGITNPHVTLDDERVRQMRDLYERGVTQYRIADLFHVSQGHVSDIVNRRKWQHI